MQPRFYLISNIQACIVRSPEPAAAGSWFGPARDLPWVILCWVLSAPGVTAIVPNWENGVCNT